MGCVRTLHAPALLVGPKLGGCAEAPDQATVNTVDVLGLALLSSMASVVLCATLAGRFQWGFPGGSARSGGVKARHWQHDERACFCPHPA